MLPMPRPTREPRRLTAGVLALSAFVLLAGTAGAQTTPPPAAPPPVAPLESGDTAPPPGTPPPGAVAPVTPVPSATALEAPFTVAPAPPPRPRPFYRTQWFWGAVGAAVIVGIIVTTIVLASGDPSAPNTRLGDKSAF
jgi:hypothetical protein